MSDWQPIETAPKDGREIIVWPDRYGEVFVAGWGGQSKNPCWHVKHLGLVACRLLKPTHWQPLPEPPK